MNSYSEDPSGMRNLLLRSFPRHVSGLPPSLAPSFAPSLLPSLLPSFPRSFPRSQLLRSFPRHVSTPAGNARLPPVSQPSPGLPTFPRTPNLPPVSQPSPGLPTTAPSLAFHAPPPLWPKYHEPGLFPLAAPSPGLPSTAPSPGLRRPLPLTPKHRLLRLTPLHLLYSPHLRLRSPHRLPHRSSPVPHARQNKIETDWSYVSLPSRNAPSPGLSLGLGPLQLHLSVSLLLLHGCTGWGT